MAQSPKDIGLIDFSGQTFSDSVMGNHTIFTENDYDKNDLAALQEKNKALYKKLKKEFDSLYTETHKLFLIREKIKERQLKKNSSYDGKEGVWELQ